MVFKDKPTSQGFLLVSPEYIFTDKDTFVNISILVFLKPSKRGFALGFAI